MRQLDGGTVTCRKDITLQVSDAPVEGDPAQSWEGLLNQITNPCP